VFDDLRVVEHFWHGQHLARRHAVGVGLLRLLGGWSLFGLELVAMELGLLAPRKAAVANQILALDQPTQGLVLLLLVGR
jgi:hypothetical protein